MRNWPQRRERRARIEIIPMIDVMMFLLVFFVLISINVLPALGLKVALPQSAQVEKLVEPRKVTLTIDKEGGVYFDGTAIALADLPGRLKAIAVNEARLSVIIASDEGTAVQKLVDVLDALKSAGVSNASIISKAK